MTAPRFDAIRLEYGCHSGRFDLPETGRPVVIAGRNGTGKTTLMEAFLRGVYGFTRRKSEERRLLELRRPWSGKPAAAEVWFRAVDGTRLAVRRDFASDEVVARETVEQREVFRGDGNPVGVRSESRRYQELIREWIGFGSLEPYRGTAWIAQGELVDTTLDDELLRAAAGTHRRVEAALKELREAFDSLTREPIELGGRRKNRSRDLEDLRDTVEQLADQLQAARGARDRKRPLLERSSEARAELKIVEAEIDLLESAYRPITERRTLLAEQKEAEAHLASLTDALQSMEAAAGEMERAEAEAAQAEGAGTYPTDFEARLAQAQVLWDQLESLESPDPHVGSPSGPARTPSRSRIVLGACGAVAAGSILALLGPAVPGLLLAAAGAVIAATAWWIGRTRDEAVARAADWLRDRERQSDVVRSRLAALGSDVPPPDLTPESAARHRQSFERQEAARTVLFRVREKHSEATDRAERLLRRVGGSEAASEGDASVRLEAARESARTALARVQVRVQELPSTPRLPEGVEATVSDVEAARARRRALREGLEERLASIELDLRDLDRVSEDVFVVQRELARSHERVAEVESEVSVRRYAWELVRDAYEEFRTTDQQRLLAAINASLRELSGDSLGPVEAVGDLTTARIGLEGREVPLDSPPLSFGEKHVALLAIRLGAAEFLSGDGTRHPLLVDEPFTHLDEVRSREVWALLEKIAIERQVIVTTQDRLVLDHLGVEPDIYLELPRNAQDEGSEGNGERDHGIDLVETEEQETPASRPAPPVQAQLELG